MPMNEILSILMLVSFIVLLTLGVRVAYAIAISGVVFGLIGFGPMLFNLLPSRLYGVATNYTLLAVPLFVFMGVMLEKSRIAEDMLDVMGHVAGRLRGGMGVAIIFVGVLMGAATGIVGATIVTLSLIALPTLLKRGYDHGLATGAICASGTLGQILPPSLILILLSDLMGESVGTLFAAAIMPGLMLAALYVIYILVVAWIWPNVAPAIPAAERAQVSGKQLIIDVIRGVLPPILLVFAVLGSIIGGVAAPTEAAAMGAFGALVIVAISGKLSMSVLRQTLRSTLITTSMIMFIIFASQAFSLAFRGLGGEDLIGEFMELVPGGLWGTIIFMMILLFILGFFLEWIEISYIVLPLLLPFFVAAGVDMVWLAMLICMNLQTSFLTPPFGWALFFIKGAAPPEVQIGSIYKGVIPFIGLQVIGLALLMMFPDIATWLPKAIGWMK
ncbi:C4-dicarboxylate ABC transporter [Pseudazoarcus pumilus]|uniref:TRAP transporter large permease protein n=2 Tax=Pseudazoarcus pumilus TaxID=2067960 RepID=A0A2I6S542_9RHOO|nr:C4-dicarboxylate ABC transporter [Pseudazoarcus pumilus]